MFLWPHVLWLCKSRLWLGASSGNNEAVYCLHIYDKILIYTICVNPWLSTISTFWKLVQYVCVCYILYTSKYEKHIIRLHYDQFSFSSMTKIRFENIFLWNPSISEIKINNHMTSSPPMDSPEGPSQSNWGS